MPPKYTGSGYLRQQLGPSKARLLADLQASPVKVDYDVALPNDAVLEHLDTILLRIDFELERIGRSVSQISNIDNRWSELITRLDWQSDIAQTEHSEDEKAAAGENSFLSVMEDGREAIEVLNAKKRETEQLIVRFRKAINIPTSPSPAANFTFPTPTQPTQVHLPKLYIREFSGEIHKWLAFWQS